MERHLGVDLIDPRATHAAFAGLGHITRLVFAGYAERSTMAEMVRDNTAMLANTLNGLHGAGARLAHVTLITGGKGYGRHLGYYKTPAKESDPRILGPMFHYDQEDLLVRRGDERGFTWTVLRPDVVIGFAIGSPMSLLNSVGVYAAVCKDVGVPLRFPGTPADWRMLHQFTDARILASAAHWSLTAESARNEAFNVTNGDLYRWEHLWSEIAEVFEMPTAAPQPMSLEEHMADKAPVWERLVRERDLVPTPYAQMASWPFADEILARDFDSVQSTVKIRRAGFHDCVDSHESFTGLLARMRHEHLLP